MKWLFGSKKESKHDKTKETLVKALKIIDLLEKDNDFLRSALHLLYAENLRKYKLEHQHGDSSSRNKKRSIVSDRVCRRYQEESNGVYS